MKFTTDKEWHVIDLKDAPPDKKEEWRIVLAIRNYEQKTGRSLANSWEEGIKKARELGII